MENQHRLIKGYKDLSPETIALMNKIKEKGAELGELVAELEKLPANHEVTTPDEAPTTDKRWVALGKTHLQMGMMFLTRAVTQPGFF